MCMGTLMLSVRWCGLQVRYQGVDWRDRGLWLCNEQRNPYEYILEDPIALAPMEVMFVKVKAGFVERRVSSALAATSYDHALNQTASVCPPPRFQMRLASLRADVVACRGESFRERHACMSSRECAAPPGQKPEYAACRVLGFPQMPVLIKMLAQGLMSVASRCGHATSACLRWFTILNQTDKPKTGLLPQSLYNITVVLANDSSDSNKLQYEQVPVAHNVLRRTVGTHTEIHSPGLLAAVHITVALSDSASRLFLMPTACMASQLRCQWQTWVAGVSVKCQMRLRAATVAGPCWVCTTE